MVSWNYEPIKPPTRLFFNFLWVANAPILVPMPRRNPLPPREVAICRRLREFRQQTRLSQVVFAEQLEIDSARLASYEHARVAVRFGLADRVGRVFDLNQLWLAEGGGKPRPYFHIKPESSLGITPEMLFSEAYDRFLRPAIVEANHRGLFTVMLVMSNDPPVLRNAADAARCFDMVVENAREIYGECPLRLRGEFLQRLERTIVGFSVDHDEAFEREARKSVLKPLAGGQNLIPKKCKVSVDIPTPAATLAIVSQRIRSWKDLQEVLKLRVSAPGEKAKLARALGVSRQAVNNWLKGTAAPSAELTLRLLHWVG